MKLLSPGKWIERDGALQVQMSRDEFFGWKLGKDWKELFKSESGSTIMHFLTVEGQPVLVYEVKEAMPVA